MATDIFKASERAAAQKERPPEPRLYSTPLIGGTWPPAVTRGEASVKNLPNEH